MASTTTPRYASSRSPRYAGLTTPTGTPRSRSWNLRAEIRKASFMNNIHNDVYGNSTDLMNNYDYYETPPERHREPSELEQRLKNENKSFCELYPTISVDCIGEMTVDQLLLLSREDFLALSKMDFVQSKLLSVYRFLQFSDPDQVRAGTAKVELAIQKAQAARETSESNLLLSRSSSSGRSTPKSKKTTPRSPKYKKTKKAKELEDIPSGRRISPPLLAVEKPSD